MDPDALVRWLPPTGMRGRFERFEPHPGGSYRMVLSYTDRRSTAGKTTANSDVVEGRFVEIVAPTRIVQAVDFVSDDPEFAGTMTMTWTLTATDGGTRLDLRADNVPRGVTAADHAAGMSASLANLAGYLGA
jgi:uncharacterized protein YndB with AHSA1/START domain